MYVLLFLLLHRGVAAGLGEADQLVVEADDVVLRHGVRGLEVQHNAGAFLGGGDGDELGNGGDFLGGSHGALISLIKRLLMDDDTGINGIEGEDITVCDTCLDEYFTSAMYGHRGYSRYFRNGDTIYCESDGEHYRIGDASNYDVYEVEVGQHQGDWYHMNDLVQINGSWAHVDSCTRLDEDIYDDEYVLDDDVVTTEDDKAIHQDDARTCVVTDAQYHWQSMVRIRRMEKRGMLFDGGQICLSAIIDSPERFSVRYTVPFANPELYLDITDGIPVDQIDWEHAEFRNFRNVVIGDFLSSADLRAALVEAYDNADHPEAEEERLAA